MEHHQLKAFPQDFYGALLRQLIKWKVLGMKTAKAHLFGMNLFGYQENVQRDNWRFSRRSLSSFQRRCGFNETTRFKSISFLDCMDTNFT